MRRYPRVFGSPAAKAQSRAAACAASATEMGQGAEAVASIGAINGGATAKPSATHTGED